MNASTLKFTIGEISMTTPALLELREILFTIGVNNPGRGADMAVVDARVDAELARRAAVLRASSLK